jgi:hypothetical protein
MSALCVCGFSRADISVVAYESSDMSISSSAMENSAKSIPSQVHILDEDVSKLLLAAQALPVGGIGLVLVTGPFAMTLERTRNASGIADLMAALTVIDTPDSNASSYAEAVRRGGSLVLVNAPDHMVDRAQDILLLHNVVELSRRESRWRQQGWEHFDQHGHPYTNEEMTEEHLQQARENREGCSFHPYDRDFSRHYYLIDASENDPYERYALAYRYGYGLVYDPLYLGKDWSTIEPRVRRQWEQHEEQRWEAVAKAIYYGFTKGQEHQRSWGI